MFDLAYIDPGSGSLIIQGAIASIVAAVVFFRGQIARFLPGRRSSEDSAESTTGTTTAPKSAAPASSSVDDAARGG